MSNAKVMLVSESPIVLALRESLGEQMTMMVLPIAEIDNVGALTDRLVNALSDLVVLGPEFHTRSIVDVVTKLRHSHPEIECIAVADLSPEEAVSVFRAGIRDVISPGEGSERLGQSLTALDRAVALRRDNALDAASEMKRHRTISVIGPKGGVGKSTIAVNLAYALAMEEPGQVVIVDLDLTSGDVADLLQIDAKSNVALAAKSGLSRDPASLKLSLSSHDSGMWVLPAPPSLLEAGETTPEEIAELLRTLGELFRYVVIDNGPGAPDVTISAADACSDLVAVATPELGGLKALDRYLDALEKIGLHWPRSHFVLNRLDRRAGMTAEEVEEVLGQPVDVIINQDRLATAIANQGIPYLERHPRTQLANGITELVERVVDRPAPVNVGKGWFRS